MLYSDMLSENLRRHLLAQAKPVSGVPGLSQVGESGGLENQESFAFLVELFKTLRPELEKVLKQRVRDRAFIDERCRALYLYNQEFGHDYKSPDYQTVLGLEDGEGRIVVGPKRADYVKKGGDPIAPLPEYLKGPHVTLFGPPDSAKMAINAVNAYHRELKGEPAIVKELIGQHAPKWGADDEDSKTPIRADLISAGVNLTKCFEGTLKVVEAKTYELAPTMRALPIKRFPGLALPCTFLFLDGVAVPLHLYDFAMHFFHNHKDPSACVFYVPKLENEEEARYVKLMMETAEKLIQKKAPEYKIGTIRLMIVLENPRAIFRTHEIIDELYPYFAGASLGWHDYLASTARLFKEDGNYRIPVKADPNIVINYILASHRLLADVVGPRGGIKVGGMYGILPIGTDLDSPSFQITLKGYFKDVVTQMKRQLTGFWVAHPDFVRLGLALVEAWKRYEAGDLRPLETMVRSLLKDSHADEVMKFILGPDVPGLDRDDPLYARQLIVADIKESTYIKNNHPDEVRYNVFQCLQYLADWLTGSGCVALPALVEGVAVRVMDDLATTERSRWEVWHEIRHGRFSLEDFLTIAHEELNFIRKDLSDEKKIVQVKWSEATAKWYPVAFNIMVKLMTDETPCEFATELLLPFTIDDIRVANDPWAKAVELDEEKFHLPSTIQRFNTYFQALGSKRFAAEMSQRLVADYKLGEKIALSFDLSEVNAAASFHGDIGEGKKTLDHHAQLEQAKVFGEAESLKLELARLGLEYRQKFGFKFLISAKGKSGTELLAALKARLGNPTAAELETAKAALWEIARKRLETLVDTEVFSRPFKRHGIAAAQICFTQSNEQLNLGEAQEKMHFEVASLSKSVASAFAVEFFREKNISLDESVNTLLDSAKSPFRLTGPWGDLVKVKHLMNHQALNMHYVFGVEGSVMPAITDFLESKHGYGPVEVLHPPGSKFKYSGAGFIVLEHLIEALTGQKIAALTRKFLDQLGMEDFTFAQNDQTRLLSSGRRDDGSKVQLMFPAFAAGAMGTARSVANFLNHLTRAYHELSGSGPISHDTARTMLHGSDLGCREFMGATMGLGVFIVEADQNRYMVHQGANDGYRCLYFHCFAGPNRGEGMVSLSTGDLKAVFFHAEVAQEFLKLTKPHGVTPAKFKTDFSFKGLKQEEIVNIGYRDLVFNAFERARAEEILVKGARTSYDDQSALFEAEILSCTNDLFARAENLLSPNEPIFDPELFGKQGKIMDSWESVRHNPLPWDELHLRLKKKSKVRYALLSTKYHTANHAPYVKLVGLVNGEWQTLFDTEMEGHSLKLVDLEKHFEITELKVQMIPDGGFSRLMLFESAPAGLTFAPVKMAKCVGFQEKVPTTKKPLTLTYRGGVKPLPKGLVNVASLAYGAQVIEASNEHYGPAIQAISPFIPLNMFDGMESGRSRKPGSFEFITIKLAAESVIDKVEVDFTYFVNNNPRELSIEAKVGGQWKEVVSKTYVKSFAGSKKEFSLTLKDKISELKIKAYPCGGLNRVKAFARIS